MYCYRTPTDAFVNKLKVSRSQRHKNDRVSMQTPDQEPACDNCLHILVRTHVVFLCSMLKAERCLCGVFLSMAFPPQFVHSLQYQGQTVTFKSIGTCCPIFTTVLLQCKIIEFFVSLILHMTIKKISLDKPHEGMMYNSDIKLGGFCHRHYHNLLIFCILKHNPRIKMAIPDLKFNKIVALILKKTNVNFWG